MCVPSLCAARRGPMSGTKSGRKQGRAPLRSRSALCCLCQTTNETLAPIRAPLCWWIVKREMRRENAFQVHRANGRARRTRTFPKLEKSLKKENYERNIPNLKKIPTKFFYSL